MQVIKRDQSREPICFDKISSRIKHLCSGVDIEGNRYGPALLTLDPIRLTMKVIEYIKDGITTRELDEHTAESATLMAFENPEYGELAGRILVSNHHKNTLDSFSITMKRLYEYKDEQGRNSPLVSRDLYKFVERNGKVLEAAIQYLRDYLFDYTGFKTLERSYLIKYQSGTYMVQERPQHMYMRMALGIHGPSTSAMMSEGLKKLELEEVLSKVLETYNLMSLGYFIHATPTCYNAGTPRPQLSSCFLLGVQDSLKGIYKGLSDCAEISKWAGGIGLHISDIRAAGSYIHGTNGHSNGILPMLKVFSDTAKYVDQCFTPNTLLYTPSGPISIGNIKEGDNVITHEGRKKRVERVIKHANMKQDVFHVKTKSSDKATVLTGEHQILVLREILNMDKSLICKRLDNGYSKFEWTDAKDLKVGDYICYPNPNNDIAVDIPDLTVDDLYIYGKQLSDSSGTCTMDKRFFMLPKEKCEGLLKGINEKFPTSLSHEEICFLQWKAGVCWDNGGIDFIWNGQKLSKVVEIRVENYEGDLYDLEVETDHTYVVANLGIVHNGGGKRMGSFAVYIEPWHPEILEFLQAKLPTGHEELRARNLFYGLWIPDLFMRRLTLAIDEATKAAADNRPKKAVMWSTFCPHECPGLSDSWGSTFDELYNKYESEGKARSQLDILKVWQQILDTQKETGTPYLLYKDAANAKSNQQNLGTIKSSNLCTEIIEYSDDKEYATCNLASISLPKHLKFIRSDNDNSEGTYVVDHEALFKTASVITYNLNRVIDVNFYPVPETKLSNEKHRPIGIGVQGLADLFHIMKIPFDSPEANIINRDIFETIYYGAASASHELAVRDGPYSSFNGSPASKGVLQFDMWTSGYNPKTSGRHDWNSLKAKIVKDGMRNSLLIAPMPTASTAQILGNTECFEPVSFNIYVKRVLAGEFTVVNKHLQKDLIKLGLWNDSLRQRMLRSRGSLQDTQLFSDVPIEIRNQYKTASELKQKVLIDMAASRGAFIDQSQSLNLFVKSPTDSTLTSMHLYAWSQGLKTGIYYLRRDTVAKAQQFTSAPRNFSEKNEQIVIQNVTVAAESIPMCRRDDPTCEACGS